MIDRAEAVRAGEELPLATLERYLRENLSKFTAATGESLSVRQFPRGYSNLTYLLQMGDQEFVLRRPPFGANIASAHDMHREYRVLVGLSRVYAKVPRPLLYCDDESVIGASFYVMERLRGTVLRAGAMVPNASRLSDGTELPPEVMRRLSLAIIDNLAAIHALDVQAAGLQDLGRPQGYVERQIRGWTRRYHAAQTDELAEIEQMARWLERSLPDFAITSSPALIHNDYKVDNLVLDPDDLTRILAVLDWEMCTLGDPLMDLGTTLGYWIEPGDPQPLVQMFGLTTLPGTLDRRQLLDRYVEVSGRAVADPLFYYVYGVFKIAVIIQQIYARYRQGHTQDERFAALGAVVQACGQMGVRALEKGRISQLGG